MIQGRWYSQGSARQLDATLRCADGSYTLEAESGITLSGELKTVVVADRLGTSERKLTLEDGSVFATSDNDAVDHLFQSHNTINQLVHRLESHAGWVALALIVMIVMPLALFKWGIPWASVQIAQALPNEANELIGQGSFEFLDKYLLQESKLDRKRMEQIDAHFRSRLILADQNGTGINYRLHFRHWTQASKDIPNALALPSGDIILTDKLVELAASQDEIDAVLLHEMGHIVNRHGLKMVIEGTILSAAVMLITGDQSGLVDMGLGVGSLLVTSHYSRQHESEADLYAFQQMLVREIDPQVFADIMQKMDEHMENVTACSNDESQVSTSKQNDPLDYLSSHPNTAERISLAQRYSDCFRQGVTVCGQ